MTELKVRITRAGVKVDALVNRDNQADTLDLLDQVFAELQNLDVAARRCDPDGNR